MTQEFEQDLTALWKPDSKYIFGLTGNFNGDVDVPGKPNYIYVRVNGLRDVEEVWNDFVSSQTDIQVGLEQNPLVPGELRVVGISNFYPGKRMPYTMTKKHGETHTWPNVDTVSIYHRQILPLLVLKSSSNPLNVQVFSGYYKTSTGYGLYDGTANFSLSAYRPLTAGARYVLLYLDSSGTLSARSGTLKLLSTLTLADIPELQDGETGLAAVRVYSGQTKLRDTTTPEVTDIVDIRYIPPEVEIDASRPQYIRYTTNATHALPPATGSEAVYSIKAAGLVTVIVEGDGSDTIDGELTHVVKDYSSITVRDAAAGKWDIV